MNTLIKYGNQMFRLESVCGTEYKKFSEKDRPITGCASKLTVFTNDGREIVFKDAGADVVYSALLDMSLDLG